MTIDEYGEGLPVAWMISNQEDSSALIIMFLKAITIDVDMHLVGLCLMIQNNILMLSKVCLEARILVK